MGSTSRNNISIPGEQTCRSQKYTTSALMLSIFGCVLLLATLVALKQDASAQPTAGEETTDAPATSGAANSPDCNSNWVVVRSPNASTGTNELSKVAALSSSDVWAVGYYDNSAGVAQTLIEHWDGSAWNIVFSPNRGAYQNTLSAVAVESNGNAWAVGSYINTSDHQQTLIEHWDGTAWSLVTSANVSGATNDLEAVAVVASGNAWAVGSYVTNTAGQTLIEHWNGTAWSVVTSPSHSGLLSGLNGVAVVSATDIWAVGSYTRSSGKFGTLVEHWDGTAWSVVTSPNGNTSDNYLSSVEVVTATDIWAVGFYQNGTGPQPLTEHWSGTAWNIVYSPHPGNDTYLFGVATVSSTNLTAVGRYQTSDTVHMLIEHGDGNTWSVIPGPGDSTKDYSLDGVAAVSATDIWAVGFYAAANSLSERTLIIRYHPCSATGTPTSTRTPLPTQTPGGPTATTIPTDSPTVTPITCSLQFIDVPAGSTYYQYVECLACRGIISGYACGGTGEPCDPTNDPYFRPNANVTRGQIAKIIALSAGIGTPVNGQAFQDVPPGSTFYIYTGQLYALGAMNGYSCGGTGEPCNPPGNLPYFRPNNNATRGQLAKIDSIVAGYQDPPSGQTFEDVTPGSTFYTYTQRLASRGVMSGYPCGGGEGEPCVPPDELPYFRANTNVTRGQISKISGNTFFPGCQALGAR